MNPAQACGRRAFADPQAAVYSVAAIASQMSQAD